MKNWEDSAPRSALFVIYFLNILFIYLFIYSFIHSFIHERHRERGRDIGRGRSRLPAGSPMWNQIPGPQDQILSRRQTTQPLSHRGIPKQTKKINHIYVISQEFFLIYNSVVNFTQRGTSLVILPLFPSISEAGKAVVSNKLY